MLRKKILKAAAKIIFGGVVFFGGVVAFSDIFGGDWRVLFAAGFVTGIYGLVAA